MFDGVAGPRVAVILGAALFATTIFMGGTALADRQDDQARVTCTREGRGGDDDDRERRRSLVVLGLTADQRLICFRENAPERASTVGQITGLAGDTSLVGIDFRPANNTLYGVGN